jgi:hypothetical protein
MSGDRLHSSFLSFAWRSVRNRLKKSSLWMTFLLVMACQPPQDPLLIERLTGVWETTEPRYAGCNFEIQGDQIIFSNGLFYTNRNSIMTITGVMDNGVGSYDILYEDLDGEEYKLSLILYKSKKGDIIRFKNQYQIYWTKKPHSTF